MPNELDAAQAAIESAIDWSDQDQAVIGVQLLVMTDAYHRRWCAEPWRATAVEQTHHLPIINPETGRPSRTFTHAGKVDGLIEGNGQRLLLEHKSTSDDISADDAPYWQRLTIDGQVSKYLLQCLQLGIVPDGCLYDVVRKPKTRPKQFKRKADLKEIIDHGTYLGQPVDDADRQAVAAGTIRTRESVGLYRVRLQAEVAADLDAWLQRRVIVRTSAELAEYARELWGHSQDVRTERRRGLWPKNSGACWDFHRPCAYLGICSGYDSPESPNWKPAEFVHRELADDGIEDPHGQHGNSILTNSSIKCFQSCRRKYQYRYELGLERVEERTEDALFWGTIWHQAQEAWWQARSSDHESHESHE